MKTQSFEQHIDLQKLFTAADEVLSEGPNTDDGCHDMFLRIARRATGKPDLDWLMGQRSAVKQALYIKMYSANSPLSEVLSVINRR